MTYADRDFLNKMIAKFDHCGNLSPSEIKEILIVLAKDAIDRSYDD